MFCVFRTDVLITDLGCIRPHVLDGGIFRGSALRFPSLCFQVSLGLRRLRFRTYSQVIRVLNGLSLACDLFIVLGSSLTVYPAAGFPALACRNGAKLVIVNQQPTDLDPVAEVVIHAGIGETMKTVQSIGTGD